MFNKSNLFEDNEVGQKAYFSIQFKMYLYQDVILKEKYVLLSYKNKLNE